MAYQPSWYVVCPWLGSLGNSKVYFWKDMFWLKVLVTSFIKWVGHPCPPLDLRRDQVQTVWDGASSKQIEYVAQVWGILNFKGYTNLTIGSTLTAFFLDGWILPICGVASERVCACSLCRRLVSDTQLLFSCVVDWEGEALCFLCICDPMSKSLSLEIALWWPK